jgi:hypothetical protein
MRWFMLNYIYKKNNAMKAKLSLQYKVYTQYGVKFKKIYLEEDYIPVIKTGLKDKNKQDIYLYDILKFDGYIMDSNNIERKNNYFICIFDNKKCKTDFLYFDKSINDFIWHDDNICYLLEVFDNGVSILRNEYKFYISKKKILSIINKTNDYFYENKFKDSTFPLKIDISNM